MKILLDPQIFIEQRFGGISRYFCEVWWNLKFKEEVDIHCPLFYSSNLHLKEYKLNPKFSNPFLEDYKFKGSSRLLSYVKSYAYEYSKNRIKEDDFDVFVPTYYTPYFLPELKRPFILTVYDMIHELYPELFPSDKTTIKNKKRLIENACKIIAISNNTKRDILNLYPHINANNIEVVHLAQSIKDVKTENGPSHFPENYLLFVGNRAHYKRFEFLTKALEPIIRSEPDLHLVCAGGGKFSAKEVELLTKHKMQSRVIQYNYLDSELSSIYAKAQAFIFPSIYEGFGIPILEAMKCGCPVILSNSSCFPEVADDSAIYFEPDDEQSLQSAVYAILTNYELRSSMKLWGFNREQQFSWQRTADACLEIYKSVL